MMVWLDSAKKKKQNQKTKKNRKGNMGENHLKYNFPYIIIEHESLVSIVLLRCYLKLVGSHFD